MINDISKNQGSFKDPYGSVYEFGDKILRGVKSPKSFEIKEFLRSDFYKSKENEIVKTTLLKKEELIQLGLSNDLINNYDLWLEHEKIDFITYPYEWSFEYIKKAAVFHLDLQILSLKAGYQIKDSSAFNIQFVNGKPIFIDILSFEKYNDGDYWIGYKQFCEHFLAPLLINSELNIDHNTFFRGDIGGLDLNLISKLMPIKSFFKPLIFFHIHLHAFSMKNIYSTSKKKIEKKKIKKANLIALVETIKSKIEKIKLNKKTYWSSYENENSYSDISIQKKTDVVSDFVKKYKLEKVLDLGCNTGKFSEISFLAGAKKVIGLDFDSGAIDIACQKKFFIDKDFTPLVYDLTNPSPSLGWDLKERVPIKNRLKHIDGLICLALIHHLTFSKNIPLSDTINFFSKLAKYALIEFVPKEDEMVASLLQNREDVFFDYDQENFQKYMSKNYEILSIIDIPSSKRKLFIGKSLNYDTNL